jgi:hypothetical protein
MDGVFNYPHNFRGLYQTTIAASFYQFAMDTSNFEDADHFSTLDELRRVAALWSASRLVRLWNGLPVSRPSNASPIVRPCSTASGKRWTTDRLARRREPKHPPEICKSSINYFLCLAAIPPAFRRVWRCSPPTVSSQKMNFAPESRLGGTQK